MNSIACAKLSSLSIRELLVLNGKFSGLLVNTGQEHIQKKNRKLFPYHDVARLTRKCNNTFRYDL